ncbi:bifunctional folylpolyglutamate synthase/dihydrofolate synthase [Pediococcus ethanolidurans]|uniref:Dihydrofolate synthase/folylpolyglutamate synthase n=1 Tax=Pediococcus ethanolidurans TaxID=319653 RepID=A0A0R2JWD2_9LACO|nr:folylpolyglutamate synthase/dihydrofolate synthase family protein [Pediococcus ethanolidurans]KRN81400.1 folylpolyglutamate synthase [Pediococcus ethanolidurans]GEN95904.1 bifunctional folylpolyglutamate synthase/dihydrofolate synthase [Pediococcus ethanolidurans]SER90507.1 dihydrofolate synthase / folylpolyglutamate synthase [Pediococcus ethanolidurans]
MTEVKTYEEAVAFIHGRTKFKKIPTLARMRKFMAALDNPQDKIKAIHIAGTNGKGSTLTFLRSMLQETGYKVGTFTSPFLTRFNERISVDGEPISDAEILRLVQKLLPIIDELDETLPEGGPTEFEIITAMMFSYFAEGHADVVLVEVGIGGLYDSTNVVLPSVSVIVNIGFDHMKLLGNTLAAIASQKAGIIKQNVPTVVGQVDDEALDVIIKTAKQKQSHYFCFDSAYQVSNRRYQDLWTQKFDFSTENFQFKDLRISMLGNYQINNASTALQAYLVFLDLQKVPVIEKNVKNGLAKAFWAGRFEKVSEQPLVVLDGAHNEPAMEEISELLKTHFKQFDIYIVLAILEDKQYHKMIQTLGKLTNVHIIATTFAGPGKRQSANLSELTTSTKTANPIQTEENWQLAIAKASQLMSSEDLLLITGSLYFISDVRKLFVE